MDDSLASVDKKSKAGSLFRFESHSNPAPVGKIAACQMLSGAKSHAELMELIGRALRELRFSDFAFTLRQSSNNPAYYFSTCAQANQYFHDLADWEFDISAMYATAGDQPLYQTTIEAYLARAPFATSAMAKSRALGSLARTLGFEEMYHLPLPVRDFGHAMLTVASQGCPPTRLHNLVVQSRSELEALRAQLGALIPPLFASGRLRAAALPRLSLGPTPLLLLNALAKDNLSLNAAAERLCISVSAANKHIATIKKNLEAKTIASAVYKATSLGLID